MKNAIVLFLCLSLFVPALMSMQVDQRPINPDSMPCCEGATTPATDTTLEKVATPTVLRTKTEAEKRAEFNLIGSWEHFLQPFSLVSADAKGQTNCEPVEGAYLKLTFRKDGIYKRIMNNGRIKLEESGHWELSPDGNTLFLHAAKGNEIQALQIKHLQMDELVLEHALQSAQVNFCIDQQDFFFNRN